jgi:hypothetical protein
MLVADGNGLPIGFHLESANRHEVKLAVPHVRDGAGIPPSRGPVEAAA